ncbi:hypothetical protein AUJ14_06095 [Candidatus Micrarchaeota archaeon CG1_02_55_22]|nr:MAG: hypothetical protein AUJ14_06095 [Candidatus Micrarchaeota archaeon CG1_02_55_22]
MKQVFPGIFRDGRVLATANLTPGLRVYGERLFRVGSTEYREWDPSRSKLGASIVNGVSEMPIKPGAVVLYLGAANGTTVSHVSDVVGPGGLVVAVEFAPRPMRDLLRLCEKRENIVPILEDARFPERYADVVAESGGADCVFEDVADPEQVRIMDVNAQLLKSGGQGMLALKARSIDAVAEPNRVFKTAEAQLSKSFNVVQVVDLEPFEKDHVLFLLEKK